MTNTTTGYGFSSYSNSVGLDPNMPWHYYEFYTPARILESVYAVLGEIDLAPCSNSHTYPIVQAHYRYTKDDNGLEYSWYDKVYMNPPYGYAITAWIEKLMHHYESGDVTEAIMLVPASTSTKWFTKASKYPCCFLRNKLHFGRPRGFRVKEAKGATAVFYLGNNYNKFCEVFKKHGVICREIEKYCPAPNYG